ncbi:MAG: VTT domain-containing protein [Actinomycetota bacterium]|nr:VTT domain-containing protein [Actinomycetota bacterium]
MRSFVMHLVNIALAYGVIGLGVGTFLESLGVPFASIALPLVAGSLISNGKITFFAALLASTSGLVLGSTASYYIGYFGIRVFRKTQNKPPSRLMQVFTQFLDRYGLLAIAIAQLYGPLRTWISIPAGAAHMDIRTFIAATAIGGIVYCALAISFSIVITGFVKHIIKRYFTFTYIHILAGIFALVLLIFGVYLLMYRKTSGSSNHSGLS